MKSSGQFSVERESFDANERGLMLDVSDIV